MDDEAERRAGAIGGKACVVQPDVVELGAQSQVWEKSDIHPSAHANSKLV
jgi:hypothetical protein